MSTQIAAHADHAEAIVASLTLAGESCSDLAPQIYARLFAQRPETQPRFARDRSGAIRGEMLARTFEAILDFVGDGRYAAQMIRSEAVTHAQYDVPLDLFAAFFPIVADAVKESAGPAWTPAYDAAWTWLVQQLQTRASGTDAAGLPR